MKFAFLILGLLFASECIAFDPKEVINSLRQEAEPTLILAGLQQLREDNETFITQLRQEKSYRPDDLYYALNLKYYLRPIKAEMYCENYKMFVADSLKVPFEELEPPINDLWQLVKKICR